MAGEVGVDRTGRIAHQPGEMDHRGGVAGGRRELGDVGHVALDQLESRVADELGDRLPAVHESIEDADLVSASQQQVDRVPADVAGPAKHQDGSVPVCDQRREEGRMPAEGQGDEQPAEDHGGRDDESPEDHAGCRRAEQDADHRRRRDRAEEHDGLPLPGRDPQPCVEARHDVPGDEQDRRHEERRGLSKGRRTGHEEGQEPDRRAHGGRAGGDVEENASFVRSEGGERPASIEARPDPRRRPHDRYRISCSSPAGTTPTVHGHGAPRQALSSRSAGIQRLYVPRRVG